MRRAQRSLAREHGFTLVETLMAGVILVILSTGIAGVLTSSIAAHTVARERTNAEQCANDVVEKVRRKDYDQVGIVSGNPPGTVAASNPCGTGLAATATVAISYEDDPTPTSYATNANYKKVTVTVTRDRDGKQLSRIVTYVSPSSRAPYGGINNAIINATVFDLGTNLAYTGGATVALSNGPSANRSDTTDVAGSVSFAALTPNPTSGAQAYYDLTVTAASGYETIATDIPPGAATPPSTASHIQLAPSQTSTTTIQIFKPASIDLVLLDASNNPYTGGAALSITSSFTGATTTDSVASGASGKTITLLGGNKIIPGQTYTVVGRTTSGLCATPASSPVPTSGYPGNTSGTFTLKFTPCPSGDIAVNVKQLGIDTAAATVTVTGGPNNMTLSGTTDASGNVTFTVPAGTGYTVTATKAGQSSSATAAVTVGSTTSVALSLPDPPTGSLVVNVTQLSAAASGATVTVSGGPWSISQTLTTGGSGQVTFPAVPGGTGYTVTATKGSDTASTTTTVTTGSTTTVNLALPNPPMGSVQATVTWLAALQSGALVTLTGGPYSVNVSITTTGTGIVTFTNVPAGTGYTVTAAKNGQSRTAAANVTAGSTTNVAIAMPTGKIDTTVTWVGLPVGLLPVPGTVTITGGPLSGTYTGSTDALGVASITVPATTAAYPYTVSARKFSGVTWTSNTVNAASQVTSVLDGGTSTSAVALTPTKVFTITIQRGGVTANGANLTGLTVSVTGGPNGNLGAATTYKYTPVATNGSSLVTTTITVPAVVSGTTPNYTVKVWGCSLSGGTNLVGSKTAQSSATGTTAVIVNLNATTGCPSPTP